MNTPGIFHDEIAKTIHDIYSSIGFKPPSKQFTVLASFYLTRQISAANSFKTSFKLISLATGTKCTPAIRYSPRGELLHDAHAEVLARRGAVRWLMEEIKRMNVVAPTDLAYSSDWLTDTELGISSDFDDYPPYRLRPGVSLHMYVSTLPCGDASMGYLAYTQNPQMASLKSQSPHLFPKLGSHEASRGRDDYNRLGVLRTKPGRADSQPALSMSCSDKIARWSVLGILGGFASRFLEPVYIDSVVIGEFPREKEGNCRLREIMKRDCERALQIRIRKVEDLPEGYDTRPPNIYYTNVPFIHSKHELDKIEPTKGSCNECLCWVADSRPAEVLINGLKRSTAPKNRYVEKCRPLLSRIAMFDLYIQTLEVLKPGNLAMQLRRVPYATAKASSARYQRAKAAIIGLNKTFSGWIQIEPNYQQFTLDGNHAYSL